MGTLPKDNNIPEILIEDQHFYIDNGLYVFTSIYLLNRGYCCKYGCRHCPYGYEKPAPSEPLKE
jgi:hypothetical protein